MREVDEESKKNIKRYAGNDREKKRTGKSKKITMATGAAKKKGKSGETGKEERQKQR